MAGKISTSERSQIGNSLISRPELDLQRYIQSLSTSVFGSARMDCGITDYVICNVSFFSPVIPE